jgi:FkbM family methyltransferase
MSDAHANVMNRAASSLLEICGRVGRALPNVRGRGRIALALRALLLKAGADPIVEGRMARGHRMRLDCRVPSHCWAFFNGGYDVDKVTAMLSFLRPGGTALDVGANIGFYTVPLAIRAKTIGAKVVAFEPVQSNLTWLCDNLYLNDCFDVVEVIPKALGDYSGSANIVLAEDFLTGSVVGNAVITTPVLYRERYAQCATTQIKIDTLDRSWSGEGRIDVIKVDIEGNETEFLKGGRKTIAAHRPVLLIEVNRGHQDMRGINFNELMPSLLPAGYFFAQLRVSGIVPIQNLAECTEFDDVLAIPEERQSGL